MGGTYMNTTLRLFLVLILAFPSSLTAFPHSRDLSLSSAASTAPALTGLFFPGFFGPLFSGDPPTAVADSYNTDEDTPLEIPAIGVLGNDNDPESDALTAILDTDVAHGILALSEDGSFTSVSYTHLRAP